jgi:hypothetical protein
MYFSVVQAQGDHKLTFYAAKRCHERLLRDHHVGRQDDTWRIVARGVEGASEWTECGSIPRESDNRLDAHPHGTFAVDTLGRRTVIKTLVEETLANLTTADLAADVALAAVVAG